MGTTKTALEAGNIQIGYTLVIEGYPELITDAADPSVVETAWSGSLWSSAIGGLTIDGVIRQSLKPWSNELSIPHLTFKVQPTNRDGDVLGKDIFRGKAANRTELIIGFGADADSGAGFTTTVRDATVFSAGDVVYANNQALKLGTPSGQSMPVAADGQGYYSPFSGNTGSSNRFTNPAYIAPTYANSTNQINDRIHVTSTPETWIGRKVALHVHQIQSGVWDTYDQSEIIFAGVIDSVGEDELGCAIIECDGILRQLLEATMFERQFVATPKEGYKFNSGQWVQVVVGDAGTPANSAASAKFVAGTDFTAGYYTSQEFADALTNLLDADSTVGSGGTGSPSFTLRWSVRSASTDAGWRFMIEAKESASATYSLAFLASERSILEFCGFVNIKSKQTNGSAYHFYAQGDADYDTTFKLTSDEAPFKYMPVGQVASLGFATIKRTLMDLEEGDGVFYNHTSQLPPQAKERVGAGEIWSYFMFGDDQVFLAKVSATDSSGRPTSLTDIIPGLLLGEKPSSSTIFEGTRVGDSKAVRVKQVLFYAGRFKKVCAGLFASVDGTGINHETYDYFPGGAGIPWSLLGNNFLYSLDSLEEGDADGSLALIVEKPTRIWDILKAEFALRMCGPIWKDGGIQLAQLSVPNARTVDAAFSISTKGDETKTITRQSTEYYCTTLKILYNRDVTGDGDKYLSTDYVMNQIGPSRHGFPRTKTIKARNSYAALASTGASVEALSEQLAYKWMPLFGKPLKLWKTSLNHQKAFLAPGDQVTLTDDFVRNPSSGERGITARPCTIMEIAYSFGVSSATGYFGEAELIYTEEDRLFPVAPVAEHDNTYSTGAYTNGRDSTTGTYDRLAIKNSEYGGSVTSHFAVGDQIRVIEVDPPDTASPDTFVTTITAIGTSPDYIELGADFGGGNPSFDGTKTYRIIYDDYSTCEGGANGADQVLFAFQSDGFDDGVGSYGDGLIQDTVGPNLLSDEYWATDSGAVDFTNLPARHAATYYADGEPFHQGLVRDLIRAANNIQSYKSTPRANCMQVNGFTTSGLSGTYSLAWTFPFPIGRGTFPAGYERRVYVSPIFASTAGAESLCRVTLSELPPGGAQYEDAVFAGSYRQTVFSTTSTSYSIPTPVGIVPPKSRLIPGMTHVTIEISDNTAFKGMAEVSLGPMYGGPGEGILGILTHPDPGQVLADIMGYSIKPTYLWGGNDASGATEHIGGDDLSDSNTPNKRVWRSDLQTYATTMDNATLDAMDAASSGVADVGAESVTVLWVGSFTADCSGSYVILNKNNSTQGYYLRSSATNHLDWTCESTSGSITRSVSVDHGTNTPLVVLAQRQYGSDIQALYTPQGSASGSRYAETLTNGTSFSLGQGLNNAAPCAHALCAIWVGSGGDDLDNTHRLALAKHLGYE